MSVRRRFLVLAGLLVCAGAGSAVRADEVVIPPSHDNTLFENTEGILSNGAGTFFFVGMTSNPPQIRRGLVRFDIASAVPAGATITGVSLRLRMNKTIFGPATIALHRAREAWGEGDSDAFGQEGGGTAASIGDATWLHTFYSDQFWTTPGGVFDPKPVASTIVDQNGFYTWESTEAFIALVQSWLDDPEENFGFIIVGEESQNATAKRFDTREAANPANRPALIINYEPAPIPAELTDLTRDYGVHLAGGLDELRHSDNEHYRLRSVFGFTALEPNILQFTLGAVTANTAAKTLDIVIESSINHPSGTARLRLRNWTTGLSTLVATFPVGNTETAVVIEGVNAPEHLRAKDGRIELTLRKSVLATFTALGFESRVDVVNILPRGE